MYAHPFELFNLQASKSGNDMMPLADHVYYVGIVSKNLTSFAVTWA